VIDARSVIVRLNKPRNVKTCNMSEKAVILFATVQDIFKTTVNVFYMPYLEVRYFLTQRFS